MHNNTNYHGWNKALTFGVGSIQLSFRTSVLSRKKWTPVQILRLKMDPGPNTSKSLDPLVQILQDSTEVFGPPLKYLDPLCNKDSTEGLGLGF